MWFRRHVVDLYLTATESTYRSLIAQLLTTMRVHFLTRCSEHCISCGVVGRTTWPQPAH
ncbi:hypothetical protein BOTBODRAFT_27300 [Botryobasidium botryosum FD-172 SS1]|uniref:Uncharacterized protein n=1 Tax=Botryobasidium botryosum (strain FD-172 SS1) TaxID=930990 RepID=A0A067MWB2_BOTB1|nr:hypothetical protein BOTBODRAFT_27300 [Botryobasidium botryosum FD-172 SS1]